ncbi:MAG: response regulator [Zoogloea sp.]|nr:response regulator [Zoogloea sp.]
MNCYSKRCSKRRTVRRSPSSASIRQVVGITLRGAGYEVIEACDGKDALGKLDGRKLNLVISDVNMPNMDGISFVKEMKTKPAYKFTPVIMLTTEAGEARKREGQAAGAKAWVVKPFQPQQMLDAVSKLCVA